MEPQKLADFSPLPHPGRDKALAEAIDSMRREQGRRTDAEAALINAHSKLESSKSECQRLKKELISAAEMRLTLEQERDAAREAAYQAARDNEILIRENKLLKEMNTSLQASSQQHQQQQQKSPSELSASLQRERDLMMENHKIKMEAEMMTRELEASRGRLVAAEKQMMFFQEKTRELETEVSIMKRRGDQLESALMATKTASEIVKSELEHVNRHSDRSAYMNDNAYYDRRELEMQIALKKSEAEERLREMIWENKGLIKENEGLKQRLETLTNENTSIIPKLESDVMNVSTTLEAERKLRCEVEAALLAERARVGELDGAILQLQMRLKTYEKDVQTLSGAAKEAEYLKHQNDALLKEFREQGEEVQRIRAQVLHHGINGAKKLELLAAKNEELQQQVVHVSRALEVENQSRTTSEDKVALAEARIMKLIKDLEATDAENHILRKELTRLEPILRQQQTQLGDYENAVAHFKYTSEQKESELNSTVQALTNECKIRQEAEATLGKLELVIRERESQLKTLVGDMRGMEMHVSSLENQNGELINRLQIAQSFMHKVDEEKRSMQETLSNILPQLSAVKQQLVEEQMKSLEHQAKHHQEKQHFLNATSASIFQSSAPLPATATSSSTMLTPRKSTAIVRDDPYIR